MWIFWIVIVVLVVWAIKGLAGNSSGSGTGIGTENTESPLDILKKRYARGEIDEAEFKQRRKDLEN